MLAQVKLGPESRILSAYPHQLSGGQRQRLVIAQALACRPQLLVADEPTAALDPTLQVHWLALMKDLRKQFGLAILLITHDPAILKGLADRVRSVLTSAASFDGEKARDARKFLAERLKNTWSLIRDGFMKSIRTVYKAATAASHGYEHVAEASNN